MEKFLTTEWKWIKSSNILGLEKSGKLVRNKNGFLYITSHTEINLDERIIIEADGEWTYILDAHLNKIDSNGSEIWTKSIGNNINYRGQLIAIGNDQSIYTAGSYYGKIYDDFKNQNDGYIRKFDSSTNDTKWIELIKTSDKDHINDILISKDNFIFVTGHTYGNLNGNINLTGSKDAFICKLEDNGSKIWTKSLKSNSYIDSKSIAIDNEGYLYITGNVRGDLDGNINNGRNDAFISKFNSNGEKIWTKLIGSRDDDYSNCIAVDNNGYLYITGITKGNLDGNINKGGSDAFLAKFNKDGTKLWTNIIASDKNDESSLLEIGANGSLYIGGFTSGDLDGHINDSYYSNFISKFDSYGNKVWSQLISGSGLSDMKIYPDGNIYITSNDTSGLFVSSLKENHDLANFSLINSTKYSLYGIKDYDGNPHGFLGDSHSDIINEYKFQGKLDVNDDGITEAIFTNKESGRWVTASLDPITGLIDYSKNGQGGTTRVVGIYEDPLVKAGLVEKDSDLDGSRTFVNDLKLDNLILKTVGDYDSDGFQEVYWSKVDNSAYLRAVMHADGNVQYANYQNLQQMTNYLTNNGFADSVALIA